MSQQTSQEPGSSPPKHPAFWWARTAPYAVVLTVLLALTGLLGSVFSTQIGAEFPFTANPIAEHRALAFWIILFVTAIWFLFRQKGQDHARRESEERLEGIADTLLRTIRTMPPEGFLLEFSRIYRLCDEALWSASGQSAEVLAEGIRRILRGIALLARYFDGEDAAGYAANLMVFIPREKLDAERIAVLRERLNFCEPEADVGRMYGVLDLRTDLSARADGEDEPASGDADLFEFTLPIPWEVQTIDVRTGVGRWRILPGAPYAFVTQEPSLFNDTAEMARWCRDAGDFSDYVESQVEEYFTGDDPPHVGSLLAIPLTWVEPVDDCDSDEVPLAVLNVHRSAPGMLKEDGEPVSYFVATSRPLRLMLVRLLKQLYELEAMDHGGTWRTAHTLREGIPKELAGAESGVMLDPQPPSSDGRER